MLRVVLRPSTVVRGLAIAAVIASIPLAPAAAGAPPAYVPGIVRPDSIPVQQPDPRTVVPTDTVVEPPLPGAHLDPWLNGNFYSGWVVPGPNIAWGLISWNTTSAGPVVGARVTLSHRVDGWRYSTTTDRFGRWRMAVPDGPYASEVVPRAADVPYGLSGGQAGGGSFWGQGLGSGSMQALLARPRYSCTSHGTQIDGAEGWAPGAAPGTTTCPYADDPTLEGLASFVRFGSADTIAWALSGEDPAPAPGAAAPAAAPVATAATRKAPVVLPVVAGTARIGRDRTVRVRVRCAPGAACVGGLTLTAPLAGARRSRTSPTILARGAVRRGRTARLRVTAVGRRETRRRTVRAQAVWTPAGGTPTVVGVVRLRPPSR